MTFRRLVLLVLTSILVFGQQTNAGTPGSTTSPNAPEIEALRSAKQRDQQQNAIRELVTRVGPEAAQDQLLGSGLPFTGEGHLLVHIVGSMLYKQFGAPGIKLCRPCFLGACFHGFLIDAIGEQGPAAIPNVWAECQNAGPAVPDQCAHAVGHGLLAWKQYSLRDALVACDSVASQISQFSAFNCYDGVFMEKVWKVHGHNHDEMPAVLEVEKFGDLDYPCDDPNVQPKHLAACWGNQASVLYQAFAGDLRRVAGKCEGLTDTTSREFCFNGLARQIHPLTNGNAYEAFRLCGEATAGAWQDYCLITIAGAAFSVGDQLNMPFQICNNIREQARTRCYQRLFPLIHLYATKNPEQAKVLCGRMEQDEALRACIDYQDSQTATGTGDRAPKDHNAGHASQSWPAESTQPDKQTSYQARVLPLEEQQYPYPSPYLSPYLDPYLSPYLDPYLSPYLSPYWSPYFTPYITPYRTPYPMPLTP